MTGTFQAQADVALQREREARAKKNEAAKAQKPKASKKKLLKGSHNLTPSALTAAHNNLKLSIVIPGGANNKKRPMSKAQMSPEEQNRAKKRKKTSRVVEVSLPHSPKGRISNI